MDSRRPFSVKAALITVLGLAGGRSQRDARHLVPSALLVGFLGLMVLAGCDGLGGRLPAYHGDRRVRGSVERVESVGAYPAAILRLLIWFAKPPVPIAVREGVRLYRISYWSQTNGSPVLVSGLMAVPNQVISRGTVLWMHGTNVDRKDSPSTPSLQDGVLLSGTFGGGGYLYLAPDLVGLGISKGPQAYLYNPSTIAVTLDFPDGGPGVSPRTSIGHGARTSMSPASRRAAMTRR